MFDRFDAWLAKTAFHPPIIWFCQVTRQTQYAVSRLLWFIALLIMFYRAASMWSQIFVGLMCVFGMISAGWGADGPTDSFVIIRKFWIIKTAVDLVVLLIFAYADVSIYNAGLNLLIDIVVLFAEYAATIKTIPPRKARERKAAGQMARVKV